MSHIVCQTLESSVQNCQPDYHLHFVVHSVWALVGVRRTCTRLGHFETTVCLSLSLSGKVKLKFRIKLNVLFHPNNTEPKAFRSSIQCFHAPSLKRNLTDLWIKSHILNPLKMDDILKVIKSPASVQKYKKLNDFVNKVKEEDLPIIFAHPDIITNGPIFLLQLATKFQAPSLFLQIVEKVPARDVRKRACKSPFLYSPESPLLETEFLEEFLSGSSYSIRRTIVNNLGIHVKDQDVGDEIFESVKKFYGLFAAAPILPVCSAALLSKILNDDRIEINDRAFVRLLKSHPEIGLKYLKRLVSNMNMNRWKNTLKYCLMNHTDDFVSIFHDRTLVGYYDAIVAGRVETRHLVKGNGHILEQLLHRKSGTLWCQLQMDQVFRCLPWEQYMRMGAKAVQSSIDADASSSSSTDVLEVPLKPYLKPLNQAKQQDLIRYCCKSILDLEVSQAGSFLTPSLIFLLDQDDRRILAEFKMEIQDDANARIVENVSHIFSELYCWSWECKEFWTAMKPGEESIPVLTKMLLREQSADRRATIGAALLFTCCVNRDSAEMLKVLQLVTKRARNDQKVVREKIMDVLEFVVHFLRFDQDHWDCVHQLFRLLKANGELSYYSCQNLFQGYFAFLLENNRPIDHLTKFIVSLISTPDNDYLSFEFFRKSPRIYKPFTSKQEKILLDGYLKAFAAFGLDPEDSGKLRLHMQIVEQFVKKIMELNRKNESISLREYPWLEKVLISSFKADKEIDNRGFVLREIGMKGLEAALESSSLFEDDLIYALKKYPEQLEEKFDAVIEQAMSAPFEVSPYGQANNHKFQHFFDQLKRRNFKSLSDKLLKESVRILEENDEEKMTNAFKVLLTLASPSLAIQYVQDFIPKESKVEPDEIDGEKYKIQRTIAAYLRFVQDPQAILPVVQKFCVGDYMKPSIGSLYGTVLNAPGRIARMFLEESLKNSPVSPKKHMIRLYFTAGLVEDQKIALKQLWPVEKNLSIRIELLQRASYLLGTNAREDVWQVYKSMLESLTPEDQDCLRVLSNLRKLTPPDFLSRLVKVFENTLERIDAMETHQLKFIEQIEHLVDRLDDEFLDNFIRNKLDQLPAGQVGFLADLAVQYLLKSHQDKLDHRIQLISTCVRNILEHKWKYSETEFQQGGKLNVKYPARLFLQDFIKKLLEPSILKDSHRRQISQKINSEILPSFEEEACLTKAFSNAVSIEFALALIYVYNEEDKASQFGERLAVVLHSFISKFGGEILSVLGKMLQDFVDNHFEGLKSLESKLELIQGLLKTGENKHNLIFAVQLLPPPSPYASTKLKEMRMAIVNVIENSTDHTVKLFYELSPSED